jgi:CRISPR-associated protein Csh2
MQPRDLNERYTLLFGSLDDKTSSKAVLGNLFSAVDVMNFGATFAEKKQNISITGAVQINQGFNRYQDTNVLTQDILSPFRNSNEKSEEKLASSMGTKIVTDEAHYVYSFSVNPANYEDFIGLADNFEGYTAAAYEKFKKAARVATTAFNTNSKSGCENEVALFIELKNNSELFLTIWSRYVTFKSKAIYIYGLAQDSDSITIPSHEIDAIVLYHNPITVEVNFGNAPLCCPIHFLRGETMKSLVLHLRPLCCFRKPDVKQKYIPSTIFTGGIAGLVGGKNRLSGYRNERLFENSEKRIIRVLRGTFSFKVR